jgi:hypothetical protein
MLFALSWCVGAWLLSLGGLVGAIVFWHFPAAFPPIAEKCILQDISGQLGG